MKNFKKFLNTLKTILGKFFNVRNIVLFAILIIGLALYFLTDARYISMMIIIPVILMVAAVLVIFVTGRNLTTEIECPVQGYKGHEEEVQVKITNNSIIPVLMCQFDAKMHNLLTDRKYKSLQYISIGRKKTQTFKFKVKEENCGCVQISADDLRITDPFRIFMKKPKYLNFKNRDSQNIYFMPRAMETRLLPDDLNSFDMESYKYSQTQKGGDPAETYAIRDYERGDSMKSIHWKLSSKTENLAVREHGLPIENHIMILVDKLEAAPSRAAVDKRTEFAAAVSYTLLMQSTVHSIGWYDTIGEKFESYRVDSESTYWNAMKAMVSCPYKTQETSSVDRFLEFGVDDEFLSYIYISDKGTDIEKLYNYGSVKLYSADNF